MDFVVNIPTFGRPLLLERTLKSLAECTKPDNYRETVVVENGPQCGAEALVKSADKSLNARYMHVPTANKSAALNEVMATLGDCLIFFSDDDIRLAPSTLCDYATAAGAHGPGHFFGGPTTAEYEVAPPGWLVDFLPASARGWNWSDDPNHVDQPVFLGFNWAAFSADLRAAGNFNPDRGPGSKSGSTGQESDMQRRFLSRGLTGIYVPGAHVWHYVPKDRCTPQWTIERNYRHGVERGKLAAADAGSLFGLPTWVMTRYLKGIAKSILCAVSPNPKTRFSGRFRRSYDRGIIRGIRIERNPAKTLSGSSPASC